MQLDQPMCISVHRGATLDISRHVKLQFNRSKRSQRRKKRGARNAQSVGPFGTWRARCMPRRWIKSVVKRSVMNAQKLRRELVGLCVCLLAAWVITGFSLMVCWHLKGGGHGWPPAIADAWRIFIFDFIPALTSGYLVFGLCLLNIILKAKKSEEGNGWCYHLPIVEFCAAFNWFLTRDSIEFDEVRKHVVVIRYLHRRWNR